MSSIFTQSDGHGRISNMVQALLTSCPLFGILSGVQVCVDPFEGINGRSLVQIINAQFVYTAGKLTDDTSYTSFVGQDHCKIPFLAFALHFV